MRNEKLKFPPVIKMIWNEHWNCIEKCTAIKQVAFCVFGAGCSVPWQQRGSSVVSFGIGCKVHSRKQENDRKLNILCVSLLDPF